MSNDNTKPRATKRSTNRYKQIEDAQKEWHNNTERLLQDKKGLSYDDFTWDAFLEMDPESLSLDTEHRIRIIDLQNRYKAHIEEQVRLWAEDKVVEELNKTHGFIHTDQAYILTEKVNVLGNPDFVLESRASFSLTYLNQLVPCIDDVWRPKSDIWLYSPKRRTYCGITFDVSTTGPVNGYYNLWRGFKYSPKKGNCLLFWKHVLENICNNNQGLFSYVRRWLAYVVQYPHKLHTALVLCGSQGVGKNMFVDAFGELFGPHYTVLSSMHELVSNFNYHLKHSIVIHANEALWGGHQKDVGTVKAMITDKACLIEGKGKDRIMVPNFRHLIISSNEPWPVHLDPDDRRCVVINVSDAHKEDRVYFKAIYDQLNNGGYAALLDDLLKEDLAEFDPSILPESNSAFDIKMLSANSAERYIYNVLVEGGFSVGTLDQQDYSPAWQASIAKEAVYTDYKAWTMKNGERSTVSNSVFGKTLKKCIPSIEDTKPGGTTRVNCYKLPSLVQARAEFCKAFKCDYEQRFGPRSV